MAAAAAVGNLNEFALNRLVTKAERQRRHKSYGQQGGEETVKHVLRVPDRVEVLLAQIIKDQHRQGDLEHEGVHLLDKDLVKNMQLHKDQPQDHQQEDGNRRVEAKNQIVQHGSHFYPFLNIFSLNSSAPELSIIVVQRSEKVKRIRGRGRKSSPIA